MSIFQCQECGCIENTASSNFNITYAKLCSACDPKIGKWHNIFSRRSAAGLLLGEDGFLYTTEPKHVKIVGVAKAIKGVIYE